jgi:hypothetical protein
LGQPPALLATQFTCSGTVLPFGISAPMALDGTAWTAEVCETDSVLEKPVVHSPSGARFFLGIVVYVQLCCLVWWLGSCCM